MPRPPRRARWQSHHSSPRSSPKNTITPTKINAQLSGKAEGKTLADSDDSDGLVTKGDGGRRGAFLRSQEVFASGAVGHNDKPNAHPTRAQRRKRMYDAMKSGSKPSKSPTPSNSRPTSSAPSPITAPAVQPVKPAPNAGPLPVREDSILNGIRPRKRQNSILRSPGLDDSTLGESTLGSLILPQDENSPLNLPKQKSLSSLPASELHSSTSKKRKLGIDDIPTTPAESGRIATESPRRNQPEGSLPESVSSLRTSGQKQARKYKDNDDADIMALPMSSSSEHSSPPKPITKQTRKPSNPAPIALTTQELQAQLMPSKRQKQLRRHKKGITAFEIPSDTDSPPQHEEDDSTFIGPGKRKLARRQPKATANTSRKLQASRRKASDKTKPNLKQNSTAPPPLLVSSRVRSARPTDLDLDLDPDSDPAAKSPSQLSSISVASPPQRLPRQRNQRATTTTRTLASAANAGKRLLRGSKAKKAQGGGSPLKTSFGNDNANANANATDLDDDKENYATGNAEDSEIEVQVGRAAADRELEDDDVMSLPPMLETATMTTKKLKGKWAEIDDFEMDFEDVSLPSEGASSDPMAR